MALVIQHSKLAPQAKGSKKSIGLANETDFMMNGDYSDKKLTITMQDGGVYEYTNVPEDVFQQFVIAPNKGSFYARYIKRKFQGTRTVNRTIGPAISKKK